MDKNAIEELQSRLDYAQGLANKIGAAEYLVSVLNTRYINQNIESDVLKKAIIKMATEKQKAKVEKLLREINISEIEKETFDRIVQLIKSKIETLETELENYQVEKG